MSLHGHVKGNTVKGKMNRLYELRGYSAYEIAVLHGFTGTEEEWILSLSPYENAVEGGFDGTEEEFYEELGNFGALTQRAETAATDAEASKTSAASSAAAAGNSATAAAGSASTASTAATNATNAKTAAETAKTAAETANTQAQTAKTDAVAARTGAEAAQDAAEEAQAIAEEKAIEATTALNKVLDPNLGLAIHQTAQGETIHATDSAQYPFPKLSLWGPSEQKTTSGKNLLPYPYLSSFKTAKGIEIIVNDDGSFHAKGTATSSVFMSIANVRLPAGSYKLSGCPLGGGGSTFRLYVTVPEVDNFYNDGREVVFTIDEELEIPLRFVVYDGTTVDFVIRPMIRLASVTDDTWEPYTGGKPSPNPEHPQPIKAIGDDGEVEVHSAGKNLCDYLTIAAGVNSVEVRGEEVWNNYTHDVGGGYTDAINLPRGNYTVSFDVMAERYVTSNSSPSYAGNKIMFLSYEFATYQDYLNDVAPKSVANAYVADGIATFQRCNIPITTTYEDAWVKFKICRGGEGSERIIAISKNLQIELGSTATEYQPYQTTSAKFTTGLPLYAIPVTSGGNVTLDGQQYIADVLTVKADGTGKVIKKCRLRDLTNAEFVVDDNMQTSVGLRCGELTDRKYVNAALCNALAFTKLSPQDNVGEINKVGFNPAEVNKRYVYIRLDKQTFGLDENSTNSECLQAFNDFKTQMYNNGTPLVLLYTIDDVEIDLTASEVQQFLAMTSYKPVTNVWNDEGAQMEVTYIADTKAYVDNKFAALSASLGV